MNNQFVKFFSFFNWIKIEKPPKWVLEKTLNYEKYYKRKYKQRPYDIIKLFKGDKFIYKIIYYTLKQGSLEYRFFVKRR